MRIGMIGLLLALLTLPTMAQDDAAQDTAFDASFIVVDMPGGYRFALPDSWEQVPDADVDELNAAVGGDLPQSDYTYLRAYSPSGTIAELPYMIVQRNRIGFRGATAADIADAFGAELLEEFAEDLPDNVSNLVDSVDMGKAVVDAEQGRVLISAKAQYGSVRQDIYMVIFLGMEESMQFNFYAPDAELEQQIGTFTEIADSFRFTADQAWAPQIASISERSTGTMQNPPSGIMGRVVLYAIIGGVLGGFAGGIVAFLRKKNA